MKWLRPFWYHPISAERILPPRPYAPFSSNIHLPQSTLDDIGYVVPEALRRKTPPTPLPTPPVVQPELERHQIMKNPLASAIYTAEMVILAIASFGAFLLSTHEAFVSLPVYVAVIQLCILAPILCGLNLISPSWSLMLVVSTTLLGWHLLASGWLKPTDRDRIFSLSVAFIIGLLIMSALAAIPGWDPPHSGPASLLVSGPEWIRLMHRFFVIKIALGIYVVIRISVAILAEVDADVIEVLIQDDYKFKDHFVFEYSALNQFVAQLGAITAAYYLFSAISYLTAPFGVNYGIDPESLIDLPLALKPLDYAYLGFIAAIAGVLSSQRRAVHTLSQGLVKRFAKYKRSVADYAQEVTAYGDLPEYERWFAAEESSQDESNGG